MSRAETQIRIDDGAGQSGPIFAERRTRAFTSCAHDSPVSHNFAVLALYVGGDSRIEQRATWTLEPGDVMIIPAGEPHRLIDARQPDIWSLGLCVPCFAGELPAALLEPFERVRDGASPVVRIALDRRPFLESLFKELSATSAESDDMFARRSLLALILGEIRRAAAWSNDGSSTTSVVAESLRFIERHCFEPLTLNDIAAALNRTPSYITTALTRATGRSAGAWIVAGRMAEARRRLLHSDERVDDIAERVGYADVTHFIRMFRRTHGATPAAWRAIQRRSIQLR